ncbi:MAG: STAS domain-containing protein [Patescibacteria group bacterium]|nr:STAS domain-containing protein [Patescibacteria group bacterium]
MNTIIAQEETVIVPEKKEKIIVFYLKGELVEQEKINFLRESIYKKICRGYPKIIFECSELSWMNSQGLGALTTSLATLRLSGGDLKLANVPDRIMRPIKVAKFEEILKSYNSVEEAIKSFETDPPKTN